MDQKFPFIQEFRGRVARFTGRMSFRLKYSILGGLLFPVLAFLNFRGTGMNDGIAGYMLPFLVGSVTGFLIGRMKDNLTGFLNEKIALLEVKSEGERKYFDLIENATDLIQSVGRDGHFLYVNRAWRTTLGYNLEEARNLTPLDIVHPAKRTQYMNINRRVMNGEHGERLETMFVTHDGRNIIVEGNIDCEFEDGAIKSTRSIFRDITERKQAQEDIRREHNYLKNVFEALSHPFYIINARNYRVEMANSAALKGQPLVQSMTCYSLTHQGDSPCDEHQEECPLAIVKKTKKPVLVSHIHDDRHGNLRHYEVYGYPIFDSDGNVRQMVEYSLEVTQRIAAEEKASLAGRVLDNLSEAIFVTDRIGFIQSINPAFTTITGYAAQEVIGQPTDLFRWDLPHSMALKDGEMWEELGNRGRWHGETRLERKNGEKFPAWFTIAAIKDQDDVITNFAAGFSDISNAKETEGVLNYLAHHDVLTGLPNRVLFQTRLEQALIDARFDGKRVAVLFLDLDRLKMINKTLGHAIGDHVLREVADRLRSGEEDDDMVARWGGDEFTVLFGDVESDEDLKRRARNILDSLAEVYQILSHEFYLSASIGISLFPDDSENSEVLVNLADRALYEAKETGRNCYRFYRDIKEAAPSVLLEMETGLRRALEKGELEIHYQPQVDSHTGSLIGMEALLRWNHPGGTVYPAEFIQLAEETGLIVPIGEWVLRTACRQHVEWGKSGLPSLPLAVNISARQFQESDLLESIDRILEETGMQSTLLELELTESTIMQDLNKGIIVLQELKKRGIRIVIDDFGRGYSSLLYMHDLPVDKIKIDQKFIRDIGPDNDSRLITKTIIDLGRHLRKKILAEGVENLEQIEFLRNNRCRQAQGYHYSRPLPVAEFTELLKKGFV